MAQVCDGNGTSDGLPSLPPFESLSNQPFTPKDKATVALRLLRQAAVTSRGVKGLPFYSIRTVSTHFSLSPTTVTRLYGQLKAEGVLGSIWGSKTVIEPTQIDQDIRIKAIVGLPVPITTFSAVPAYRHFVRAMQRMLCKQRFGSHVVFYDDAAPDASQLADMLLEYRVDIVIWLMPFPKLCNAITRLVDRGVKSVTIGDQMPINGEFGYYLSWEDPLLEGLSMWRRSHIRRVIVIEDPRSTASSRLRLLHSCLAQAGIACDSLGIVEFQSNPRAAAGHTGLIFTSAQSIVQFAYTGLGRLADLLEHGRVLFVHGGVDLPFAPHLNPSFDSIEFDWRVIARRLVSDLLIDFWRCGMQEQTIFKASWRPGNRTQTHQ